MKLFPILAFMFAMTFTGERINDMYQKLVVDCDGGVFTNMDLLHHLTSGGKSLFT